MMISILVPVYKTEAYLPRCMESILRVEYKDMEVILVDDGSPDNSGRLCDEYAERDNRVSVIHRKNGGIAAARNAALDVAKGKWILFCDSDDYYDTEALRELIAFLEQKKDDSFTCFNYNNVWPENIERGGVYPASNYQLKGTQDHIEFCSSTISHKMAGYALWDKVYAKEQIDAYNLRGIERDRIGNKDDFGEDLVFNLQYMMCAKGIEVIELSPYCLRKHGTKEEQSESGLAGRIHHFLNYFIALEQTAVYQRNAELQKDFWKIALWHLRRYFYIEITYSNVKELREKCIHDEHYSELHTWIRKARKEWKEYQKRWDKQMGKEYRIILDYIVDGCDLKYKIRNKMLWLRKQ